MKKHLLTIIFCTAALTLAAAERQIVREKIFPGVKNQLLITAKLPADFKVLPQENSYFSYTKDDQNLYLSMEMIDGDVVNESVADQASLQKTGDAVQFFIKTAGDNRLWEVIADASGHKSCFFHWSAGRMFYPASGTPAPLKITVKSVKNAAGWRSDIVFPFAEAAKSQNLPADAQWHIIAVRYNYGKNISNREVSTFPQAVRFETDPARFGVLAD